jgi:hypothetical protein
MKDVDDVVIEACIRAESDAKKRGMVFDDKSFFMGYIYGMYDITNGKLPQVLLEAAINDVGKLIKKKRG